METFMCPPIIHLLDEAETNIQNYHACQINSGGAHYLSRKHDNFDIGWARVQISVLVSDKPMCVLEKIILLNLCIYICAI